MIRYKKLISGWQYPVPASEGFRHGTRVHGILDQRIEGFITTRSANHDDTMAFEPQPDPDDRRRTR